MLITFILAQHMNVSLKALHTYEEVFGRLARWIGMDFLSSAGSYARCEQGSSSCFLSPLPTLSPSLSHMNWGLTELRALSRFTCSHWVNETIEHSTVHPMNKHFGIWCLPLLCLLAIPAQLFLWSSSTHCVCSFPTQTVEAMNNYQEQKMSQGLWNKSSGQIRQSSERLG